MPTLKEVKSALSKYLYISNMGVLDVVLGAIIANQLPGPPICLYLIGPPGSGKTEILNGLQGYYRTHHPSKITTQSLLSGYVRDGSKKKREPGEDKLADKSMLINLQNKGVNIIVFKDFTTILAMPHDQRQSLIGQFREIADGRYTATYGTGESVVWEGKMALITGVTAAIDELGAINSILGERFLSFRMRGENVGDVFKRVVGATKELDGDHQEFQDICTQFLLGYDIGCDSVPIDPAIYDKMENLAAFVSFTRTAVSRNFRDEIVTPPEREGFGRISRQLQILGSGIALARKEDLIGPETFKLLKKVCRDTISPWRHILLRVLYENKLGITGKDIQRVTNIPYRTLYRNLDDLTVCGLVTRLYDSGHGNDRPIFLSTELRNHIAGSEVFIYDYVE